MDSSLPLSFSSLPLKVGSGKIKGILFSFLSFVGKLAKKKRKVEQLDSLLSLFFLLTARQENVE